MEIDWEILGNIGSFIQGLVSVITLFTIIISFIYISAQTKELRNQNELSIKATVTELYKSTADIMIEIDRFFAEYPNLKKYFYSGESLPQDSLQCTRVLSIAEMLVDYMELVIILKHAVPQRTSLPWDGCDVYFSEMFKKSPAVQQFWQMNRHWYDPVLQEVFDPIMSQDNPVFVGEKNWIARLNFKVFLQKILHAF